jgi:hypothetical protein
MGLQVCGIRRLVGTCWQYNAFIQRGLHSRAHAYTLILGMDCKEAHLGDSTDCGRYTASVGRRGQSLAACPTRGLT